MKKKNSDALSVFVAGKIEEARTKSGLSQKDFAELIKVSRQIQVNIENGRQNITIQRLYDIAEVLGIETIELLPTISWYKKHKDKRIKKVITFVIEDE